MAAFDLDAWVARSGALDLSAIAWSDVKLYPVPPAAIRTLTFMQDIEHHTIMYLRSLLHTRAIDDPEVATFLACWVHEEIFHGLAIGKFLEAAGHPVPPRARPRSQEGLAKRLEAWGTAMLSGAWPDFCAVHMTWGAINELTTLTGYNRLRAVAPHPVLSVLLERIAVDESRHFFFYYRQAEMRMQKKPAVARVVRALVKRFWGPVGSGVGTDDDIKFLGRYLFGGEDGRAAARKIDTTIQKLPGFGTVPLIEAWLDRQHVFSTHALNGGSNGHGH